MTLLLIKQQIWQNIFSDNYPMKKKLSTEEERYWAMIKVGTIVNTLQK